VAAEPRATVAPREEGRDQRFGFNNLIHRMTGNARDDHQPSAAARPAQRVEPARDDEDARMEIPAFLRRQAN
jgi:cell division protein FtsZ